MAADPQIYSLNEFRLAIKYETTIGTINVTTMQLINVDQDIVINDNPVIVSDYRSGVGRIKKSVDHFAQEKGQLKSISFGGIADKTVFPILAENCAGIAEAGGTIDINFDYGSVANGPASFLHGASNAGNAETFTQTVALVSPIAANTRVYPGCIVDDLVWTEDQGVDGGRRRFTCTMLTKYNPSDDQATPSSMSAYPSTFYSIYDYTQHVFGDATNDKVIWKVEVALKSNPRFFGLGTNGIPEVISRGYPGFEANVLVNMKYDANTMSEYLKYPAGTTIQGLISDNATIGSATTGFESSIMKITSDLNLNNVEDGAFIDVPAECLGDTSGDTIKIAI